MYLKYMNICNAFNVADFYWGKIKVSKQTTQKNEMIDEEKEYNRDIFYISDRIFERWI